MACIIKTTPYFDLKIEYICTEYGQYGLKIRTNIYNDIIKEVSFIKDFTSPKNLLTSKGDFNYPEYRYFFTSKYQFRIYIKSYPEENIIKLVNIVYPRQLFHHNMFVEQLRKAFKELGGDYDEATRQYLAEQARRASMSEIDKEIELFKLR